MDGAFWPERVLVREWKFKKPLTMAGNEFSVVTFNLNGFNQGSHYLHDLLDSNDIVCVQEHWLSSSDEDRLNNINIDFTVIAPLQWMLFWEKGF